MTKRSTKAKKASPVKKRAPAKAAAKKSTPKRKAVKKSAKSSTRRATKPATKKGRVKSGGKRARSHRGKHAADVFASAGLIGNHAVYTMLGHYQRLVLVNGDNLASTEDRRSAVRG